ncbi:MAG: hypothetical protein M3R61_21450 [Chloroflexota bacterium]|nr:hypothetical protein [Chloroflexota bacterium]
MSETALTQQLAFVVAHRKEDEATVLAQAVREGVHTLYLETLIQAYLIGQVSREEVLKELGPDQLEQVEYQRNALERDITWGLKRG